MLMGQVAERLIRNGYSVSGYNLQKGAAIIETADNAKCRGGAGGSG